MSTKAVSHHFDRCFAFIWTARSTLICVISYNNQYMNLPLVGMPHSVKNVTFRLIYIKCVRCLCLTSSTCLSFLFSAQLKYLLTMSSCLPFFFAHRVLKCDTLEIFVGKILCVTKAADGKPTHLPKHLPEKGNKKVPPDVSQN